jgi:hypothetical protein
MRITESQLRRIIREEVTRLNESAGNLTPGDIIDTDEKFQKLGPGDEITVSGNSAVVEWYENPILYYVLKEKSGKLSGTIEELDTSYALSQDQDLGEGPLVLVKLDSRESSMSRPPRRLLPRHLD